MPSTTSESLGPGPPSPQPCRGAPGDTGQIRGRRLDRLAPGCPQAQKAQSRVPTGRPAPSAPGCPARADPAPHGAPQAGQGAFCLVLSSEVPAALVFPVPSLNTTRTLSHHKARVRPTPTKPQHVPVPHRTGGLFVTFYNKGLRAQSRTSPPNGAPTGAGSHGRSVSLDPPDAAVSFPARPTVAEPPLGPRRCLTALSPGAPCENPRTRSRLWHTDLAVPEAPRPLSSVSLSCTRVTMARPGVGSTQAGTQGPDTEADRTQNEREGADLRGTWR